jgi:hypothetical protein
VPAGHGGVSDPILVASLALPAGSSTAWLLPFQDGHPPIGWDMALRYLALPALVVAASYLSSAIIQQPQPDPEAEKQPATQVTKFLLQFAPLMVGWFSLQVRAVAAGRHMQRKVHLSQCQWAGLQAAPEHVLQHLHCDAADAAMTNCRVLLHTLCMAGTRTCLLCNAACVCSLCMLTVEPLEAEGMCKPTCQ